MRPLAILVAVAACHTDVPPDRTVETNGTFAVGTSATTITDATRSRTLGVQLWFPTADAPAPTAFDQLELPANQVMYAGLLASAPSCPTRTLAVANHGQPLAGSFPVVLFSHCHSCTRLANATTAARLASHGFVVAAVDHTSDTVWDHLAGHDSDITSAVLEIRAADVRFLLDTLPALIDDIDPARVGVFGHSFGSVTAGRVAQLDDRVSAAAGLCAPMDNPLTPGVSIAALTMPLMFIVAEEDNSITEFGNTLIRNNFRDAPGEVWKYEVPDAGHWSVSDEGGLLPIFAPGCGPGKRQTDGSDFTYLEPETGRALTAAYVTAFFKATLLGDAGARSYLDTASFGVTADHR